MQRKLAPFVFTQLSSVASIVSGSMVYIAIPWIALELSGSSSTAGFIVAITAIPTLLLAPFIGSFIDKFGCRRTTIAVEILAGGVALLVPIVSGLWELTIPALIAIGIIRAIIVPGGGTALFYASQHLRKMLSSNVYSKHSEDTIAGIGMIANVCEYPLRTIVDNTGVSPDVVVEKLKETTGSYKRFYVDMAIAAEDPNAAASVSEYIQAWAKQNKDKEQESRFKFTFGYNAATGQFTDLVKDGVIDPVQVTRLALSHATSVVGLLLTCNAVLVNKE